MDKEQVILNKKAAIKALNKQLERFINDSSDTHLKKANLISYWLKTYAEYLAFEEKFDPKRNIAYKRGNVVKVNFGFNIGSEYGGLHYAVVLDNKNDHSSPVVTVVPLTSIKDDRVIHVNSVELGNELYHNIKLKYDTISKAIEAEQIANLELKQAIKSLLHMTKEAIDDAKRETDLIMRTQKIDKAEKLCNAAEKIEVSIKEKDMHTKSELEYLDKISEETSKMKQGSVALVNQITTISKMRIYDPKNARGVLSGISLSEDNMEKINNKVKELFVF
ncbi:MAG: type II toxin-antitoxin system PemK/MazF family toxin [Emergencia sp.]